MHIISIDVGIKNLAYNIFQYDIKRNTCKIVDWKVCSLLDESNDTTNLMCSQVLCQKNPICYQITEHTNDKLYWCKLHYKKHVFYPEKNISKLKKNELLDLYACVQKKIPINCNTNLKKELVYTLKAKQAISLVKPKATKNVSLIDIGKGIVKQLSSLDVDFSDLYVLIENQISPIATRMKSIQAMITQYFIMKEAKQIYFISSTQKLKIFSENKNLNYKQRKQASIDVVKSLLGSHHLSNILEQHKKKDDLADAFLQGIVWIRNTYKKDNITFI